jgi:hypothetical protein
MVWLRLKVFFFGMVTVLTFVGIDSRSGFEQKGYGLVTTQSFFFWYGYGFNVCWYRLKKWFRTKRLWFGYDSKFFFFGMVTVLTFVGIDVTKVFYRN